MQLWWCLRHFSPESWKSSAQIQKLMENNDFKLKDFFLRTSPLDTQSAVLVNLPNFLTRSPKIISSKSEIDEKNYFSHECFFPWKSPLDPWKAGSATWPFIFLSIVWKIDAHSPKKKKLINIPTRFFSKIGSSGHFGFTLDNPTEKFCAINRHMLSFEIRECEAQIPNRKFH